MMNRHAIIPHVIDYRAGSFYDTCPVGKKSNDEKESSMKKFFAILLMALLVISLVACSPSDKTNEEKPTEPAESKGTEPGEVGQEDDPIIIGAITDLTGNGSILGNACNQGWTLAVDTINENGGVLGRKLKLVTYDCKSDPQTAVDNYQRLVQVDGASIVVGPPFSNIGLAVAPVTDELKVPFFGQFGDPRCMLGENLDSLNPYMFLVQPSAIQAGIIGGAYPYEKMGMTKVAMLIAEDHAYCATQAKAFMDYAKEVGIEIMTEQYCKIADTDLTIQLTDIKNSGAEFLYNATNTGLLVIATNQMYQMDIDMLQCGSLDFSNPWASQVADPAAASNIYFPVNLDMDDPSLSEINAFYEATFGEEPTPKSYMAYDTVLISVAAIEKAGSADSEAIRDALETISGVECLITDNFTMDPETHMPKGLEMCIYNIENAVYKNMGWYVPEYLK